MLSEDPQLLFDAFVLQARDYVAAPSIKTALELDRQCMQLYPLVARVLKDMELSNQIRDFGRGLPRKESSELAQMLEDILVAAGDAGLTLPE